MALVSINENDPGSIRRAIQKLASSKLGVDSIPVHAGLILTGLTASRIVATDADKKLVSLIDPLIVAKGGTGAATLTDHGILLGSGTNAVTILDAMTNGQLPIGSTGADPVLATLTGTANQITVTNAAGSITLSTPQDLHTGASPAFVALTIGTFVTIDGDSIDCAGGSFNITGVDQISIIAGGDVDITCGEQFSVIANYITLQANVTDIVLTAADEIIFRPSGDLSDYIKFRTVGDVPEITTVGTCNLKITADGGTIDFDNEILKTTGSLTDGTNSLTIANAKAAYDDKINSATFNAGNGVIILTQQDTGTVMVDIDGRYLIDIVSDVSPQLGADLDGRSTYDLTNMVHGTFSGTVQAEQLTSTDDLTMAGLLTNTLAAADGTGIYVEGITNDYTGNAGYVYGLRMQRDFANTLGDGGVEHYGIYSNSLIAHTLDGVVVTATDLNYGSYNQIIVDSLLSGTPIAGINEENYGIYNYVYRRTTAGGAIAVAGTMDNYGTRNYVLGSALELNAAGKAFTINSYGTYSQINVTGTQTAGTLTLNNYGDYIDVLGGAGGTSVNYGLYIARVSGANINWGIYDTSGANGMIEGNLRLGSTVAPTEALHFADAKNIAFDTTTGTKIGTATGQKLAFWNVTPAIQPSHIVDADGALADITTKFNTLLAQMATIGLQAAA